MGCGEDKVEHTHLGSLGGLLGRLCHASSSIPQVLLAPRCSLHREALDRLALPAEAGGHHRGSSSLHRGSSSHHWGSSSLHRRSSSLRQLL